MEEVLKNLEKTKNKLAIRAAQGLKLAGLYLQGQSQKVTPVEHGPLKASAFTRATGSGFRTEVEVGYTAFYAIYVHEAVDMKLKGLPRTGEGHIGFYWDPQNRAQAKFLEEPFRRLKPKLISIVKKRARVL
jgi:hypothetical protein